MRLKALAGVCALSVAAIAAPTASQTPAGDSVSPRASQIHRRAIVVDTHDDTPQRLLFDKTFDIGRRHDNGSIDVPRMREGGLDALFDARLPGISQNTHGSMTPAFFGFTCPVCCSQTPNL